MTEKITVFMLSGKSRNGKDALFEACKEVCGWKKVAFADALKSKVADLYNFSHEQMYCNLKDEQDERYPNLYDPAFIKATLPTGLRQDGFQFAPTIVNPDYKPFLTPRRVLQVFGQDQRKLFPDIWASYVFSTAIPNCIKEGFNSFVVTDLRFKNEIKVAESFKNNNFNIVKVRVNRPGVGALSGANDISETDLDDYKGWDFIIQNDLGLNELKVKGISMLEDVKT